MPRASSAEKKRPPADATDRRRQIVRAAIEVFAERGFHKTRVSDIARRAGVAYGLIYHYFPSKDAVLGAVFDDSWAIFIQVLQEIAAEAEMASYDKLGAIADHLIGALRLDPNLIQVIIQEISRSDRFGSKDKVKAFDRAFEIAEDVVKNGQAAGELSSLLDPHVTAYLFFGALEALCTGAVLGKIAVKTDQDVEQLKGTVRSALLDGLKER